MANNQNETLNGNKTQEKPLKHKLMCDTLPRIHSPERENYSENRIFSRTNATINNRIAFGEAFNVHLFVCQQNNVKAKN